VFLCSGKKIKTFLRITQGNEQYKAQDVPFITNGLTAAIELLKDTVSKNFYHKGLPTGGIKPVSCIPVRPIPYLFHDAPQ